VVRVRDGKAELVDVRRGVATPDLIEVFGALSAGDLVLKRGTEDVPQGSALDIQTPAMAASSH
jgi:hypothetical protein